MSEHTTPHDSTTAPTTATASLQIAIDCADPHRLADFWAAALGYVVEHDEDQIRSVLAAGHATEDDVAHHNGILVWKTGAAMVDPEGKRNRFFFQLVPEPKVGKNRMHIDIHLAPGGAAAEIDRMIALGATKLYEGRQGPYAWTTMADIEGNEFCIS